MARSSLRTTRIEHEDHSAYADLPAGTESNTGGEAGAQSWCSELVTWHSASYHDTGAGIVAVLVA